MDYCELHLHDHYSPLDGLNTPTEYMVRAKELGFTHLAQTNHETLTGHRDFQKSAEEAGITPILGVEAYISSTDRFDRRAKNSRQDGTQTFNHIGLLALNENGLKNLQAMQSEAYRSGYYYKPRIDMDLLEEYAADIAVLSGCMNGLVARRLERDEYRKALAVATKLKEIAGERFFMEIQGHNDPLLNKGLLRIADELKILPVVTSDCHYARKEDLWVEEAMLILSAKPTPISNVDMSKAQKMDVLERYNYLYPNRRMTFEKIEIFLRSADEQKDLLAAQGIGVQPILNTMEVAKMVEYYPRHEGLDLLPTPRIEITDENAELRKLAYEGLARRGRADDPVYTERLDHELDVIAQMGFARYFLVLSDVVEWAIAQGIFIGPGRGSGVSSLVNYALHITNIDPIPYKLLFFRFLDPDRPDWPDVDIDFEPKRRYEVKDYVDKKYGHTANILTVTIMRGKASLKAAARVFKIPNGETTKAMKALPTLDVDEDHALGGRQLSVYEETEAEDTVNYRNKYPEVLPLARALEGRISGYGMHAGGTILSKEPIEKYVPMQTANDPSDEAKGRVPVIGVDMKEAEKIGLIKMDFLGLNNLAIVKESIDLIKQRHDITIDPYDLIDPYDNSKEDPKVFEEISKGYTKGVFQCEGGAYTSGIMDMHGLVDFDEWVASNALIRPGAANSSIGKGYIKGKETGDFEYIHADTKYFTSDTYGQILFQEQQMLLCTELAGMSMREANAVRRAISKKKAQDLAIWKPAFVEGAAKKVGQKKAEFIWTDLEKSAEYAFNKAHSVGYSLLGYWTAWLKVNYPIEFMTALLNNTDDKTDRLRYLIEVKRLGIKVRLPHVNASDVKCSIEDNTIRMGLSFIKGVRDKSAAKIIDKGPYNSYAHFMEVKSVKGSGITAAHVTGLDAIGALEFDDHPRTGSERENYYEYLNIPAFEVNDLDPIITSQLTPLDEYRDYGAFVVRAMVRDIKYGPHWTRADLVDESGEAGVFISQSTPLEKGRMYVMLLADNRIARYASTNELLAGEAGTFGRWLEKPKLNLAEDEMVCISWSTRWTRAKDGRPSQEMANAVLSDADKRLYPTAVFGDDVKRYGVIMAAAAKIKPILTENDKGYTMKGIKR